MAFSATLVARVNFGNDNLRIYNLTDVQDDGTSVLNLGFDTVHAVKAVNNSDSSDTFKESVGADSSSSTRNQVTFTSATNDDDGQAWIWGK